MSALTAFGAYYKAISAAVGAVVFPPIAAWLVGFIPAPDNVHTALSVLLIAVLTGGAVYHTPNVPKV